MSDLWEKQRLHLACPICHLTNKFFAFTGKRFILETQFNTFVFIMLGSLLPFLLFFDQLFLFCLEKTQPRNSIGQFPAEATNFLVYR